MRLDQLPVSRHVTGSLVSMVKGAWDADAGRTVSSSSSAADVTVSRSRVNRRTEFFPESAISARVIQGLNVMLCDSVLSG